MYTRSLPIPAFKADFPPNKHKFHPCAIHVSLINLCSTGKNLLAKSCTKRTENTGKVKED